jgi:hypothetical protein
MKTPIKYYGNIDGDIDTIIIYPSIDDSIVNCNDGFHCLLKDVTEDGIIYIDGKWVPYFTKELDLHFLHYVYLMVEIIELNEYTFP